MSILTIIAGSNTSEVFTLQFDTEAKTLVKSSSVTVGNKPSWVTAHPRNKSVVFTALKIKGGRLIALEFDDNGNGKVLANISTKGDAPSSLIAGTKDVIVGNVSNTFSYNPISADVDKYDDATIFTVPILEQAPFIDVDSASSQVLQLDGNGPHPTRQTSSHPHQVLLNGLEGDIFVPDLGADKTWRLFRKDSRSNYELSDSVFSSPPGSNYIYVLHELRNTLSSFDLRAHSAAISYSLPSTVLFSEAVKTPDAVTAGEILIPQPNSSFPVPYIYVSNRYDDRSDGGDTIGIFRIADVETGKFEYVTEVETDFKQLRAMEFIGADGRWLIAGGVFKGGVKVFERTNEGKDLKLVAETEDGELPCSFVELVSRR